MRGGRSYSYQSAGASSSGMRGSSSLSYQGFGSTVNSGVANMKYMGQNLKHTFEVSNKSPNCKGQGCRPALMDCQIYAAKTLTA